MNILWTKLETSFLKPVLPAFFFFAGVTYDSLTLTRIDRLFDNLILLFYLTVLGVLVILTGRFQLGLIPPSSDPTSWNALSLVHRAQPHLAKGLQFLLGGLFSAYAIFYSQSTTFSSTAIFLGIIVAFLIGNEFLQTRYSSLKMLVSLFALVTLSFMTFFLPVLTGWMNSVVFVIGVLITGVIVWQIVRLTLHGSPNRSFRTAFMISVPAFGLIVLCTVLYFMNWIPPIPLSLKFGGIYHAIEKNHDEYTLTYEKGPWYDLWKESNDRVGIDAPVYCFSSVFAPITLQTTIYHHWQWQPFDELASFRTTDRIPIVITGGREKGYRSYTTKRRVQTGEWRVNVETEDGRLLGHMTFIAEENFSLQHEMTTITR
ncbi:MAG: DUF2914 domain-containing protein [Nitrospirota bacterium]|nr:DUF2914 domain-containing protein [Nitrospirota bacterium]